MTTVSAGTTASYTFTANDSVRIDLDAGELANVRIVSSAGLTLFSSPISNTRIFGPFPVGAVMSITAMRGDVDYTVVDQESIAPLSDSEVATTRAVVSGSWNANQSDVLAAGGGLVVADTAGGLFGSSGPIDAGSTTFSGERIPRVLVLSDGDSKAAEPINGLRWWLASSPRLLDIGSNLGVGGSMSGNSGTSPVGLTHSSRLAAMAAAVAAGLSAGYTAVDMFLTIGTNDISGAVAPETIAANVRLYADAFADAGGRYLMLMSIDPRTGATANLVATNHAYADLANSRSWIRYIDTTPMLVDWSATTTFDPIGASGGLSGAVTSDGLHCSGLGEYFKSVPIGQKIAAIYEEDEIFPITPADIYAASTAPRGNIVGAVGRMLAMGGTNSSTGGTVTGTPPSGWTLTGALAGLTVAFSETTSSGLATALGLTAAPPCVRMTLSGTASADVTMTLARTSAVTISRPGAARYSASALMYANALTGLQGMRATHSNITNQATAVVGKIATTLLASHTLPSITSMLCLGANVDDVSNPFNTIASLGIAIRTGTTVSGSLDLIGVALRRSPLIV